MDDWVFGVSSVSKDGFESPVASAVPAGRSGLTSRRRPNADRHPELVSGSIMTKCGAVSGMDAETSSA